MIPLKSHDKMSQHIPVSDLTLCNLCSFLTNSEAVLWIGALTLDGVSALSSLISSSSGEIERLVLQEDLPAFSPRLAECIRRSLVRSLAVGAVGASCRSLPGLVPTVSASLGHRMEQLELEKCRGLTKLRISRCRGCHEFLSGIANCKLLEALNFSGAELGDYGVRRLVWAIKGLPNLRELGLRGNAVSVTGAKALSGLRLNALTMLDLWDNELGDEGIESAAMAFPRSALQSLNVAQNGIGPAGGERVAIMLGNTWQLRVLDLSCNPIGDQAARAIGEAIRAACARTIEELDVSDCRLGSKGVVLMFGPMAGWVSLRVLRIGWNAAGNVGARAAGICHNNIGEAGAQDLATALRGIRSLLSLNLELNKIEPAGAAAVLDSIRAKHPMEELDLMYCRVGDEGAEALGRLIQRVGCTRIYLKDNGIHARGARSIVDSITSSTTCAVDVLDLSQNPLQSDGTEYIAGRLVKRNSHVRELNMERVHMGDQGARAVAHALMGRRPGPLRRLTVRKDDCEGEGLKALRGAQRWDQMAKGRSVVLSIL